MKIAFKRAGAALFIFIAMMLICTPAFAILQSGSIDIFAVTDDHKGMAAQLLMSTIPGTGKTAFITSNSLVGKDTQTTGNIALQIAQKRTDVKVTDKDFIFDIRANASEVDGPSAGAAMTLLSYSMLSEKPLPPNIAVTGTINNDGSVGMVGGVGPKAQAASKIGIELFMIPIGEAVSDIEEDGQFKTVNLLEYGPTRLGMKIVEVSTIDDAIKYAYMDIASIQVDSNDVMSVFLPPSIQYAESLVPMQKVSASYVSKAKSSVDDAKKALEQSTLPEEYLGDLYQRYASMRRGVEMAQRYLDQNYLYSAANSAFNTRILAETVIEVANYPSLLSGDETILNTKLNALRSDITLQKSKINYMPSDYYEWVIGAQQRIAYAQKAVNEIPDLNFDLPSGSTASDRKTAQDQLNFEKVYDYVSARTWLDVAKEFFTEASKSSKKKVPYYTEDFRKLVSNKIFEVDKLIKDSNFSESSVSESKRRLAAAKISMDNNFVYAALYDAYFAEAFIMSETNLHFIDDANLLTVIEEDINAGSKTDSIWGNMYFDHAKFYYESALFDKKLGREEDMIADLKTSFDLIFLNKKIGEAMNIVDEYVSFTQFAEYTESTPEIGISYTKVVYDNQVFWTLVVVLIVLIALLAFVVSVALRKRGGRNSFGLRQDKLLNILSNLEYALKQRKISDAEYFFLKKRYEGELKEKVNILEERKKLNNSISNLKAKQRALEKALIDLRRHYKEGLMIPEDFEKSKLEVINELQELRVDMRNSQNELRSERELLKSSKKGLGLFKKKEPKIKGTEEMADDEAKEEEKEKIKRKRVLRRYAYSKK